MLREKINIFCVWLLLQSGMQPFLYSSSDILKSEIVHTCVPGFLSPQRFPGILRIWEGAAEWMVAWSIKKKINLAYLQRFPLSH